MVESFQRALSDSSIGMYVFAVSGGIAHAIDVTTHLDDDLEDFTRHFDIVHTVYKDGRTVVHVEGDQYAQLVLMQDLATGTIRILHGPQSWPTLAAHMRGQSRAAHRSHLIERGLSIYTQPEVSGLYGEFAILSESTAVEVRQCWLNIDSPENKNDRTAGKRVRASILLDVERATELRDALNAFLKDN